MSAVPSTWTFHLIRATAFAVVSTGLGTVAHLVSGGCLSRSAAAGGLSLAFVAGSVLARRERTLRSILPVLGAVQVVLHLYFGYSCAAGGASSAQTLTHLHHHACCALVPGTGMIMMHGWAVALTGLWLARGEAALWGLVRQVGARLIDLVFGRPSHGVGAPRSIRGAEPGILRPAVLRHVLHLRGPPAGALAVSG